QGHLMVEIPLIVSIPPRLSRRDAKGTEVGEQYQSRCIDSWLACGFSPYSINSKAEVPRLKHLPGVTVIATDQDGLDVAAKPFVFLSDVLAKAKELTSDVVALTNADILFDADADAFDALREIEPGHCVLGRRHGTATLDSQDEHFGQYQHGYDFFAFHTRDIKCLSASRFMLGAPWWDHFLPVDMALNGIQFTSLPDNSLAHLEHEERWNQELWIFLGRLFIKAVLELQVSAQSYSSRAVQRYLHAVSQLGNGGPRTLLKYFLRHPKKSLRTRGTIESMLTDLSNLNLNLIEELHYRDIR